MKVRDVIREVEAQGWYYVRTAGDYRIYQHATRTGIVVIAGQLNSEVKPGTLVSIRRQARGR